MLKIKPAGTPIKHWISGLIALFIALASLLIAIDSAVDANTFQKTALRSSGTVTAKFSKHHVLIKFLTQDGKPVEYVQTGFMSYEVGDQMIVLYEAASPQHSAKTNDFGVLWEGTIDAGIFFALFLLASFLMIFFPKYIEIHGLPDKK